MHVQLRCFTGQLQVPCAHQKRLTQAIDRGIADGCPVTDEGAEHAFDGLLLLRRDINIGCDRCRGTGYRGRIGIFEIFRLNDEMHELVLKRESTRTLAEAARKHGMRTLGQSGWEKVKAGHTTLDEVLRVITVAEK